MNPTDIYEALDAIARAPFDPAEFGFSFAEATDNSPANISRARGGMLNFSDLDGGVLFRGRFHSAPARTGRYRPAILVATDGDTLATEDMRSSDRLYCACRGRSAMALQGERVHPGIDTPHDPALRYSPGALEPTFLKMTFCC